MVPTHRAYSGSPEILHIFCHTNSRELPSGLQSQSHSGVSRCSASRSSKQKLGAAATLAWDRSGGSIKIFLDTGGFSLAFLSSLSFFSFFSLTRRSATYIKKKKSKSPHWCERRGNGLDDDRIRGEHVQSIRLSCSSRRDGAIRRIRETNFRRCLSPPLIFLAKYLHTEIGTTCDARVSPCFVRFTISKYSRRDRCLSDYLCSRSRKL